MKISASSVVTGNTTYYAQWRANTYVVRFHRNHSSFDTTVKEQSFTYGREQELSWISGGLKWDNPTMSEEVNVSILDDTIVIMDKDGDMYVLRL